MYSLSHTLSSSSWEKEKIPWSCSAGANMHAGLKAGERSGQARPGQALKSRKCDSLKLIYNNTQVLSFLHTLALMEWCPAIIFPQTSEETPSEQLSCAFVCVCARAHACTCALEGRALTSPTGICFLIRQWERTKQNLIHTNSCVVVSWCRSEVWDLNETRKLTVEIHQWAGMWCCDEATKKMNHPKYCRVRISVARVSVLNVLVRVSFTLLLKIQLETCNNTIV